MLISLTIIIALLTALNAYQLHLAHARTDAQARERAHLLDRIQAPEAAVALSLDSEGDARPSFIPEDADEQLIDYFRQRELG